MTQSISKGKIFSFIVSLGVVVLLIAACATKDKEAAVSDTPTEISEVQTTSVSDETGSLISLESEILPEQLNIILHSNMKLLYSAYKLTNPERLVVELANTSPGGYEAPIIIDQGIVRKVTPIYFKESNTTRIEVELDNPTEYNIIKTDEKTIAIEIKNLQQEKVARAEISPETSAGNFEPDRTSIKGSTSLADTQGSGSEVSPYPAKEEEDDFIYKEAKPKEYTGQKISLDFQDADVKNILRLLAEVSKLNIITTPEVSGSITMRLLDVPWDQALDIVLKNNNLGMEQDGNIIRVATREQIESERNSRLEAREKLLAEKATKKSVEPLVTETIKISYADISTLTTNLEALKSERGRLNIDERTFTIIAVDIKENLEKMKKLVDILDTPTEQVSIEARIVEVNRNYSRDLGIQWGGSLGVTTNRNFPNTIGVTGGGAATSSRTGNYLVDLPAATGTGAGGAIGLMMGNISGTQFLDVQLSAMEQAGKGKIISNPRVTTKDNVEASISSGTQIPYQTVSQNGTKTELVDASITLTVTPHITPDGYISMKIDASKNEPSTSVVGADGTPGIDTRKVNTEVLVKDGDTIVLGGLFETTESESYSGVPWLADIPVLGWLFKKKSIKNPGSEKELLIFITPKILQRQIAQGESHEKIY